MVKPGTVRDVRGLYLTFTVPYLKVRFYGEHFGYPVMMLVAWLSTNDG